MQINHSTAFVSRANPNTNLNHINPTNCFAGHILLEFTSLDKMWLKFMIKKWFGMAIRWPLPSLCGEHPRVQWEWAALCCAQSIHRPSSWRTGWMSIWMGRAWTVESSTPGVQWNCRRSQRSQSTPAYVVSLVILCSAEVTLFTPFYPGIIVILWLLKLCQIKAKIHKMNRCK